MMLYVFVCTDLTPRNNREADYKKKRCCLWRERVRTDHPFISVSICPFTHPCMQSSICPFTNSHMRASIRRIFIHPFIRASVHPCMCVFICPVIHPSIYLSSIHSSRHSLVHLTVSNFIVNNQSLFTNHGSIVRKHRSLPLFSIGNRCYGDER